MQYKNLCNLEKRMMEKEEIEETNVTRFDERRKELSNVKTSKQKTDLGVLNIRTEGIYHEEGIKKVLSDLEAQKKACERNIEILKERVEPAPELTQELEELEEKIKTLNIINYKKRIDEKAAKKDQDDLKDNEENLKKVKKDIQDIKNAIGSRLNLD